MVPRTNRGARWAKPEKKRKEKRGREVGSLFNRFLEDGGAGDLSIEVLVDMVSNPIARTAWDCG
jgi:hypothetical protein